MKFSSKFIVAIMSIALLSSCASIVSHSTWPLAINTDPTGAKIEIMDRNGLSVYKGESPAVIHLKSGAGFFTPQSYTIKLKLDGYAEKIVTVGCTLNGWYVGNIVFGGLIGLLIVDPATGAMYRLDATNISETLVKTGSTSQSELKIMSLDQIPANMRNHLVAIK